MIFLRVCLDKADTRELRIAHRAARQRWLEAPPAKIVEAGPLFAGDDEDVYAGTAMLIEAGSREEAMALHEDDPFTKAGIYGQVVLLRYQKRVG